VKRLGALLTLLGAVLVAGVLSAARDTGDGTYRVDAIFDNASGLIPGQDVKVAGARVGRVQDVTLTADRHARVQMSVDPRFAPFRSDADCTIQPQSLIGEKFVQCLPGTPRGHELRPSGGEAPTVPLERTQAPVDLDLVFSTFRLPYRQRVSVLVNELGGGLAGRADDLNAAIRRANPALQEAERVLAILDRDRARLGRLVDESDRIIGELARRRGDVTRFIDRAAAVTEETADRRGDLAEAVRRLPPLLTEARPTLARLRELAEAGTPVAADLERAAPQVNRLVRHLGPLADAGRPALDRLGEAAEIGTRVVSAGRPVVTNLRTFARQARPTGALVRELFESLRATGTVEGLQSFVYFASAATSRFDRFSHILPAHLITTECQQYTAVTVPRCDARFAAGRTGRAAQVAEGEERALRPGRPGAPLTSTVPGLPGVPSPAPAPGRGSPLRVPQLPLPQVPGAPPVDETVNDLLGFLLG
jgi:phospholipid/cholesterol/gamma-HCH transport system substrate-binding protein